MDLLIELGISDNDLRNMIEQIPDIFRLDNQDINNKIDLLKYVGCNDRHIRNIIVSNPNYLNRMDEDVIKLIIYLKGLGFNTLNLLFDMNPYFLNYDVFEIKNYIDNRLNCGVILEDIISEIEDNPYIIEE